jgi:serine/threonine protein kinase
MSGAGQAVGCGDFALLRLIGVGSFGKVFQVRKRDTGKIYAMKVLRKARVVRSKKGTRYLETERAILEDVKHPYIVSLRYAFQTDGKLYLIMDYLNGGELFYHLSQMHRFGEELTCFYAAEITLALAHLHKLGIVYRDLKPENCCLDGDGNVVLTDFGLAKEALHDDDVSARSFCGTAEYMAPEIVTRQGHGRAVDWWSLGALVYEMMTGLPPFMSDGRKRDEKVITQKILRTDVHIPTKWSEPLKSLVRGLLDKDWKTRLGSAPDDGEEVKRHPFFANIDWDKLAAKAVVPPFTPVLKDGAADVSNFDPKFTEQTPVDSPIFLKFDEAKQLDVFRGFSYVAPHAMTPRTCNMVLVPNPSYESKSFAPVGPAPPTITTPVKPSAEAQGQGQLYQHQHAAAAPFHQEGFAAAAPSLASVTSPDRMARPAGAGSAFGAVAGTSQAPAAAVGQLAQQIQQQQLMIQQQQQQLALQQQQLQAQAQAQQQAQQQGQQHHHMGIYGVPATTYDSSSSAPIRSTGVGVVGQQQQPGQQPGQQQPGQPWRQPQGPMHQVHQQQQWGQAPSGIMRPGPQMGPWRWG